MNTEVLFPCVTRQDRIDQIRWTRARRWFRRELAAMRRNGHLIAAGLLRIVERTKVPEKVPVSPTIAPKPRSPMAREIVHPSTQRHRANWATLVEVGSVIVSSTGDRTAMFDKAVKHRAKVTSRKNPDGGWTVILVRAPEVGA